MKRFASDDSAHFGSIPSSSLPPSVFKSELLRLKVLLVVVLTVMTSYPVLIFGLPIGHDLSFHLARIESIALGLREGLFPVRLYEAQAFGSGYPTGICYPDLFLYPAALLRAMGLSLFASYTFLYFATNAMTCAIALFSFTRMFKSNRAGVLCCTLWTFASYRLCNMFIRASLGEGLALAFAPLLAYSISLLYLDEEEKYGWVYLGLAMAGIVHSHLLSVLLSAIAGIPFVLAAIVVSKDKIGVLLRILKATILALLLTASFWVPFFSYYMNHALCVKEGNADAYSMAVEPAQLLIGLINVLGQRPYGIGWSILFALPASACVLLAPNLMGLTGRRDRRILLGLTCVALLLMAVTTRIFPWHLSNGEGVIATLVTKLAVIQFPWRFLGQISLILVIICGIVLKCKNHWAVTIFACVLLGASFIECSYTTSTFLQNSATLEETQSLGEAIGWGDYYPSGIDTSYITDGNAELRRSSELLSCEEFTKLSAQRVRLALKNESDEWQSITLPLLWHKQYQVYDNASDGIELQDDGGYLKVSVCPRYDSAFEIAFIEPVYWRVAEVVTFITVIAFVIALLIHWKRGFEWSTNMRTQALS